MSAIGCTTGATKLNRPRTRACWAIVLLLLFCAGGARIACAEYHVSQSSLCPASPKQGGQIFEIAPTEKGAWYQRGDWPLIGGVIAVLSTNGVAIFIVWLQTQRSLFSFMRQRRAEFVSSQLSELYNPLLTLLDMNGTIFKETGPPSFPMERGHPRDAAEGLWAESKKKILENNREIENILRTKAHLIYRNDSLDYYLPLLVHLTMYELFQSLPTDRYAAFRFPPQIRGHVADIRTAVLSEFDKLSGA